MPYSEQHKTVLQAVIHEGALHEDRGKELVIRLFDHNNTAQILSEINAKLQPLCMTIKRINCEITGELYWIFMSTVQDKTASYVSHFSQTELALLRNVYSEIITSDNSYVSSTFCLNLCSSLNAKLTKTDAELFLLEMVDRQWLYCKDGKYYMGVRSIAELLQYFKDTYEENLQICTLCKQELFYGDKCDKCDAITHVFCLKNYARDHSLGCPNCLFSTSRQNLSSSNTNCAMDVEDASQTSMEIHEMAQSSQTRKLKRKHKNGSM
ncbi:Non-structural maintenance of chromosomes element 1 like protein [Trachymyrmex septentrionalis]|uniref:Non-structural maintenance of chromosomes element 1 homolog n=2 Tax=Trachymyrmex septentrionalis TaxID=34720 RepID=A0A195EVG1_9HYME|nr:PREDICTED: non-structural maintenance of chromosomes element 1 homolog isoform X2 [Trachymyrmex septentrionalis]XP_018353392.1 PREDICTED: non-structural maintenance of chromosomes element 1 homolog isoform X2 [Trachymyrmex septentrionalis]KYN31874.1 Non-structural maintenance of chromosomes element 1 like protein [Trachymyrmex septentrionalis]